MEPTEGAVAFGIALDLLTSFINHSCDPNSSVFFEDGYVRVRSLRQIAAGEELTIAYCDTTWNVLLRQTFVKTEYQFDCKCE